MNKKLKVAIYCRVANESQFAIDNQRKILELYCEMKKYKIYNIYIDNGCSANGFRPAYDLMLRDLKQGKFNLILSCNMDRLNRSFDKMIDFMELLNNSNCKLETLDYSNGTISKILENIRVIQRIGMYLRFSTEEKAKAFFGFESRGVR